MGVNNLPKVVTRSAAVGALELAITESPVRCLSHNRLPSHPVIVLLSAFKLEFHDVDTDTDTDILARILADTPDTRDVLKLFLWQAE